MNKKTTKTQSPMKRGIVSLLFASLYLVILPGIMYFFGDQIVEFLFNISPEQIKEVTKVFDSVLNRWMIFGIPLLILAFLRGYFEPGSVKKMIVGILTYSYTAFWIYISLLQGLITIDGTAFVGLSDVQSLFVTLDLTTLVIVLVVLCLLKNFIAIAEYIGARKDFKYGPDYNPKEIVDYTIRLNRKR